VLKDNKKIRRGGALGKNLNQLQWVVFLAMVIMINRRVPNSFEEWIFNMTI